MKLAGSARQSAPSDYSLFNNSRFYILVFSFLLSLGVVAGVRLQIPSDQLFHIRLQQIFGLLCVLYWYIAVIISPLGYVVSKHRLRHIAFGRRAIGVSAFYFAVLHASVALWGQLGGVGQLQYLPSLFQWSILAGAIAVGVLSVLAVTSFDRVIKFMTFRRWKWLHRLIYAGGILAVIHIWSVGTHLAYTKVQIAAFAALVILSGLETFRVVKLFVKKHPEFQSKDYFAAIFVSLWVIWIVLIMLIPAWIQNYHSRHTGRVEAHTGEMA